MDLDILIPLLIASLVTIVGWYVFHLYTKKRYRENKRKELIISYLIEVWGD